MVSRAFTLIELLVVLAVLALLITIAVPRYVDDVERARETTLRTDLKVMREAIDHFEADQGRLPKDLGELVARRYLKEIPIDPITDKRDTWIVVSAAEAAALASSEALAGTAGTQIVAASSPDKQAAPDGEAAQEALADIHSGAEGKAKDGSAFRDW